MNRTSDANEAAPIFGLAAACSVALALPADWWPVAGAAIILFGGLPHGASDTALAKETWQPLAAQYWREAFIAVYLLAAALTIAVWMEAPRYALAGFLALSAWHFGHDDAAVWGDKSILGRIVRGSLPILGPPALHTGSVGAIFTVLAGPEHPSFGPALAGVLSTAAPVLGILVALQLGRLVASRQRTAAFSLLATGVLLVAFPPWIGFPVYFASIHAWPQMERRREALRIRRRTEYARIVWPYVAGALTIVMLLGMTGMERSDSAVFALFAGLAALTVPHCFVPGLPGQVPTMQRLKRRNEPCRT